MFTIIGADQKQYGPVSADEIRQWIRDGRADGRTLALQQGTAEWKPLYAFPEFAATLGGAPSAAIPPIGSAPARVLTPGEILSRDYDLDIFSCISRGWKLVSGNAGPVIGTSLLVGLAWLVATQLIGLISYPSMDMNGNWNSTSPPSLDAIIEQIKTQLMTQFTGVRLVLGILSSLLTASITAVLTGGLYKYYLKLMRGERAEIGDAFSGFTQVFANLAIAGVLINVLIWIVFVPSIICAMVFGVLNAVTGTVYVICIIPAIYLSVALKFTVPLVIDKGLSWSDAMRLSMKVVNKHWFMVFGLILVAGLVYISGFIVCCIGLLFTIPVGIVSIMYAYEDIFGRQAR